MQTPLYIALLLFAVLWFAAFKFFKLYGWLAVIAKERRLRNFLLTLLASFFSVAGAFVLAEFLPKFYGSLASLVCAP